MYNLASCLRWRFILTIFSHLFLTPTPAPWFFWPFFRIISPFIDPVTRSKIKFVDLKHKYDPAKAAKEHEWVNMFEYYTPEQLEKDFNGSLNFKWDFAKYWQTLLDKTGNPF